MAALMGALPGGYAGLIVERRVGLPTVHVDVDFTAPLRFGDVARVALSVAAIGRSSCRFEMSVVRTRDDVAAARVAIVCVSTDLSVLRAVPWPADVRALLEAHRVTPARGA
jgi:4-hydroxybenzoyl-CoA thioesterase